MRTHLTSFKLFAVILPTVLLSACGYNPLSSVPPATQQCIGIQRKILFAEDSSPSANTPWKDQVRRQQLQKQFADQHCYKILQAAKGDSPVK